MASLTLRNILNAITGSKKNENLNCVQHIESLVLHDILREVEKMRLLLHHCTQSPEIYEVKKSLAHLKSIASSAFAYQRRAGESIIHPLRLDIEEEIGECMKSLSVVYPDIHTRVEITKNKEEYIAFQDPSLLKVILENVFENALRFGTEKIQVNLKKNDKHIELSISNDMVKERTSRHGIGLILVQRICDLVGVTYSSKQEKDRWQSILFFSLN